MRALILTLFATACFLSSCNKKCDHLSADDYLVFGHFYGMCQGEACIEIFRLEDKRLLEDSRDEYPSHSNFYNADFSRVLSTQQFDDVKDLTDFFPTDLLSESNHTIGQPDAGDWGGLYIEYQKDGERYFWILDKMKSNVPSKYHEFIDKVEAKIALLQ